MTILKTLLTGGRLYSRRYYATGSKLIETIRDNDTGISIISMARAPVNSLNIELLGALKASLLESKENRSTGIILTSSLPNIFSAGLDIVEIYNSDAKGLSNFWHAVQDTWLTLYSLEIPVAAAIQGSSPGGGCLLAISTEYRVFVEGKHTIGLNETQLGLAAPKWFMELYIALLGNRQAENALLRGTMFKPETALQIGLVDELAKDKADAIEKCKNYILSFKNISAKGRSMTKLNMRSNLIQWMKENKEIDTDNFLYYIQLPKVHAGLKMYIEYLKQKQH
ncbi:hypothetical protein HN011_004646 [Eciton burchellii]|nr:hypothetical protein HN011_004646 [Eciton burchellii]